MTPDGFLLKLVGERSLTMTLADDYEWARRRGLRAARWCKCCWFYGWARAARAARLFGALEKRAVYSLGGR